MRLNVARLARLFKQTSDTSEWLRRIDGELLGPGREIHCLFRHRRRLVSSVLRRDFDELCHGADANYILSVLKRRVHVSLSHLEELTIVVDQSFRTSPGTVFRTARCFTASLWRFIDRLSRSDGALVRKFPRASDGVP